MDRESTYASGQTGRLSIAIVLNGLIFLFELVGGLLTGSLALISDAMHNLSDCFALVMSLIASKVMLWRSNPQKSYGYIRVEILVAFINAITLVLIGGYIMYEGVERFFNPKVITGTWVIAIAAVGFLANTASTLLLHKDSHRDLNARSAYYHLFTDAAESLAVVFVGIMISWRGWYILDTVVSIVIGFFVIKSAWSILDETFNILTEGTPKDIDLEEVADYIRSFHGVKNVHHLHIWSISSQFRALSAHLVIRDCLISQGQTITRNLERGLKEVYSIDHPTFQLESEVCEEQETIVDIHRPSRSSGSVKSVTRKKTRR